MARYTISQLQEKIIPIAEKYGVKGVALIGSYAKGRADNDSDVDLLIDKGEIESQFQLSSFRLDVEDALSLPVDLATTDSADDRFLSGVQKNKVTIFGTF